MIIGRPAAHRNGTDQIQVIQIFLICWKSSINCHSQKLSFMKIRSSKMSLFKISLSLICIISFLPWTHFPSQRDHRFENKYNIRNGRGGMAKSRYYFIQTPVGESICLESNQYEISPTVTDAKCCSEIHNIGNFFIPNTMRNDKLRMAKSRQQVSLLSGTHVGSNQRIIDSEVFKTSSCKGSIRCNEFSCFPISQEKLRAAYKNHDEMLDEDQMFMYLTRHDILEAPSTYEVVGNEIREEGPSQVSASTSGLRGLSLTSTTMIPSAAPIASVSSSSHPTSIGSPLSTFPPIGSDEFLDPSVVDDAFIDESLDELAKWEGWMVLAIALFIVCSVSNLYCFCIAMIKFILMQQENNSA